MDRVAAHGDGAVLVVPQRRAGVEVPRESIRPDAEIDLTLPDHQEAIFALAGDLTAFFKTAQERFRGVPGMAFLQRKGDVWQFVAAEVLRPVPTCGLGEGEYMLAIAVGYMGKFLPIARWFRHQLLALVTRGRAPFPTAMSQTIHPPALSMANSLHRSQVLRFRSATRGIPVAYGEGKHTS